MKRGFGAVNGRHPRRSRNHAEGRAAPRGAPGLLPRPFVSACVVQALAQLGRHLLLGLPGIHHRLQVGRIGDNGM
jgi:hypothetical protein